MLTLRLLAFAAAASAATLKPAPSANLKPVLALRGGLGGVDAGSAATWAARIYLANGIYTSTAPGPACEGYGMTGASALTTMLMQSSGFSALSCGILSLCVMAGVDLNVAFGWAQLVWAYQNLNDLLNNNAEKYGMPVSGVYLLGAISAAGTYCGFTNTAMPLAMKLLAGWTGLNGVIMALAPDMAREMWGVKAMDKTETMMLRGFGYTLCGEAILGYSLATGVDTATAVGRSLIPLALNCVDGLFVGKAFADFPPGPAYAWLAVTAGLIGTTLF